MTTPSVFQRPRPIRGACVGTVSATLRALAVLACSSQAASPQATWINDSDLELVLAVDVSSSMTAAEQRLQREGYARALRSPEVLAAIRSGTHRRIAIAYFEWARPNFQRIVASWTVVASAEDAAALAVTIETQPTESQGGTSISAGLLFAASLFETTALHADRRTVDVSGDGPNNDGPPIIPIRNGLISRGIVINGLAISVPHDPTHSADRFGPH